MLRISHWLLYTIVAVSAAIVPVADLLTRLHFRGSLSINLLFTVLFFCALVSALLLQRNFAPVLVTSSLLTVGLTSSLVSGSQVQHAQYLLPVGCFVLGISLFFDPPLISRAQILYWFFSLLAVFVFLGDAVLGLNSFNRASAPAQVIAVLVLLTFGARSSKSVQFVSVMGSMALLIDMQLDKSRMATLLGLVIFTIVFSMRFRWHALCRVTIICIVWVASVTYWSVDSNARQRLFGNDASVKIGPITINGEGRTHTADISLGDGPHSFWNLLFGSGVGKNGTTLVDAGSVLDKPHNEFIRLFVDTGWFGVVLWACLLLWIGVIALTQIYLQPRGWSAALAIGITLILCGFSYSDNALSYSWLLIPCGIFFGLVRSHRFRAETAGGSLSLASDH